MFISIPAKTGFAAFLLIFCSGFLWSQDQRMARIPSGDAIQQYLSEAKEYAVLFNGKIETPYEKPFANHPYLATNQYVQGALCYNGVVYQDVFMRLDLFRDELTVFFPGKPYRIVLEPEKFNYAVLSGFTVIASTREPPVRSSYVLLLKDGCYPVVKQYRGAVREEVTNLELRRNVRFQEQYFVYVDGVARPVNSKNALLKLFADRKKELNAYARQHKLSFRSQSHAQSVIALIDYYETLNR